jgi:hypothetical protein
MVQAELNIVNIEYRTRNVECRSKAKALCFKSPSFKSKFFLLIIHNPKSEIERPASNCLRLSGRPLGFPSTAIKVAGIPGASKPKSLIPSNVDDSCFTQF